MYTSEIGNKPQTDGSNNIVNQGRKRTLPPGVNSASMFGNLFIEMGELKWLTYDGNNYLEDYGKGPKIQDLYANIKFWGEDPSSKGIYLKFQNGMKPRKETAANKYRYGVNAPEPSFERYIDDMGALVIDFYSVQEGLTIGTSKIIVKLYIKRAKQPGDMSPLIELRGTFPITLVGNNDTKIGEFSMSITSSFQNKMSPIPDLNNQLNMNQRDQINLNEDTFESNEQLAKQLSMQDENSRLHAQMNQDNRIASSMQSKGANPDSYQSDNFNQVEQERPTRDKPASKIQNSKNLTGKNADLNFQNRQQINLDEETIHNQGELESILARGERLRKQMADAIEPSKQAWEQIHGIHNVPKPYIPPFMKETQDEASPEKIKEKMYEAEVDTLAMNPFEITEQAPPLPPKNPDYNQQQNCEEIPDEQAGKRQIKDMKFIRIKVKQFRVESDQALISKLIDESFNLQINIPLPDPYQKKISVQQVHLNNYEVENFNEFAFNSLSMYNFRIDEQTLADYVQSKMTFKIPEHGIDGSLSLNKLIMAEDFKIEETIDLIQTVVKAAKLDGRVKTAEETFTQHVGTLKVEINLQSGDSEDEVRRNYQIKMKKIEEENARQEAERVELNRKKMQFVMEQAPVFGQIYMHIVQLGHNDNIGERTKDQVLEAENFAVQQAEEEAKEKLKNQAPNQDTGGFTSSLNQRAPGTDEEAVQISTDLEREKAATKKISLPKRNLFVQFKAFPGLETLKTNTAWQQNDDAMFNYRSQFPVLMSPDTLDRMEKFVFVLELWDQISPSVQEFIGLVKIPLAPICYSMKTTDQEVYSLNFMADQFCMYPMIVSDGYLPIYSPKLGQDVGHLKVTLAMGSPVQVNRLIQKEQAEEKRIQQEIEEKNIRLAEEQKEKELKAAKRAKKEKKRQLEEERKKREEEANEGMDMFSQKKGGKMTKTQMQRGHMLRTSMNSDTKPDYDQRTQTMLNCMRKLFEEARAQNIEELNGEALFKDESKNFDGSVQKDEVMYTFLNNQSFSLTRIELSQVIALMLDINRDDNGKVDIDELHFSFKSYIKYYELIEQRIVDLLEKFKISIVKRLELQDIILEVVAEIEQKAEDSKMPGIQLREILEDRHGVQIRDALYDQFSLFFDLDRDQQVYVTSLCEYLKMSSSQKINFFKVSPTVITTQIAEYIKNAIETQEDCLPKLEEEFKQEIWKVARPKREGQEFERELDVIPADLLLSEKINAKLFQYKLKRMGIALSLWEIFTFFEFLNTKNAKMFFEPQRYHHVMFGTFYTFIKSEEYNRSAAIKNRGKSREKKQKARKAKEDKEPYDLEKNGYRFGQNDGHSEEEEEDGQPELADNRAGYWHRNDLSDTEDPRKPYKQIKHIFEIKVKELKNIPVLNKFICQTQTQAENNINQVSSLSHDPKFQKIARAQANKYIQNVAVKYSFPLDEDEILESDYLQLNKDALDQQGVYNYNVSMDTVHTYIIGKEDNIKRVLELCQSRGGNQNAPGQGDPYDDGNMMNANQARREELFNMSIALYQDNREYIIGNSHLPIEDLIDAILQFEQKNGTYNNRTKKSSLNRTLFLYGTTYSQRENCIIGKLQLELQYTQEKIYLSKKEALVYKEELKNKPEDSVQELSNNPYSCFMHRETYINRKIPLNAKLSILIDRVSNLKESIENIEHFAKIQHSALGMDFAEDKEGFEYEKMLASNLSQSSWVHNKKNLGHMDRRRVLKHILKNGLNLIVRASVFEEDQDLVKKFDVKGTEAEIMPNYDNGAQAKLMKNYAKYQTRMLYNSLNPVFGEVFEMNLQMDTKIFEYLKNKRAVFEVRHYIIESQKQKINKLRESHSRMAGEDLNERDLELESQGTIEDGNVLEQCDYIVLGYVRVPLLQLITKNNGVDGDFSIFDEFKQKMGSLKMRITLNHHNSQRPLYSTSSKLPNQVQNPITQNNANAKKTLIDKSINLSSQVQMGTITRAHMSQARYILGLDFIELILKERRDLVTHVKGQTQRFFLKYRLFNQNYQTKFIGGDDRQSLSPLNILLQKLKLQKFDVRKATFLELDMLDQTSIEQAFGKPVEIQLWHKIESLKSYERPIKEEMIGQFFIELNELSKITNRRLKVQQADPQPGKVQVFEGYFSLHECRRDILTSDRLGMRLFLFPIDESNELLTVDDLNRMFNQHRAGIEEKIAGKLDTTGKGYTDSEALVQAVKDHVPDEYLAQKLKWFIQTSLEFKSVDQVYYSPLFGLPPPFFKYSQKFDQLEIICKLNAELESLDSTDNGFIPVNLFRNALEDELRIKSKIVDDFVNSIRDINIENSNVQSNTATVKEMQSLDVNLITNSLKTSHIDYIVLVRKLSQFMDQNQAYNDSKSYVHRRIVDNMEARESAKEVVLHFEVDGGMGIKNPLSPHEKPNSYVCMKPTFRHKEPGQFIQTNQIKASSYPNWDFKSQAFTMPLDSFNRDWLQKDGFLEFEVFHKAVGASNNLNVQESSHLIGAAFVSLKPLVEGNGRTRITGNYEVVAKQSIYNQSIQSLASLQNEEASQGTIKIAVTANINMRKLLDGGSTPAPGTQPVAQFIGDHLATAGVANSISVVSETSGAGPMRNVSFGAEYAYNAYPAPKVARSPTKPYPTASEHHEVGGTRASRALEKVSRDAQAYHESLQSVSGQHLDDLHKANMNDLEELTRKLKQTMTVLDVTEKDTAIVDPVHGGFGLATFKTEAQQTAMARDLEQFREDHLKKPKVATTNPFASIEVPAKSKEIEKADDEDDLVRGEARSQGTSDQQILDNYIQMDQQRKDASEAQQQPADLGAQRDSVASGRFGRQQLSEDGNVFKDGETPQKREGDIDEMNYDEEEMKRLDKIFKQQ